MPYMCIAGMGRAGFVFHIAEMERVARSFCLMKDFDIPFH